MVRCSCCLCPTRQVFLTHATYDSGSLSSANLLGNNIGVEQAQELVKIKEAKRGFKTLCGFTMDETEVDLSKKGLSAGCAVLLASEIPDMGALSSLTFPSPKDFSGPSLAFGAFGNFGDSNTNPFSDSAQLAAAAQRKEAELGTVTINTTMTDADLSGKKLSTAGAQILVAFMSTKLFEAKGALASLTISNNQISSEQEAKIKQICAGLSIKCTICSVICADPNKDALF